MAKKQWVYYFGDGKAEGGGEMKNLLGGKGAGLAEMTNLKISVPPGFTITTEVDHKAELLLKFEDGTPAAVRTGVGSGNLLLLNMSPAPSWSDLARQEIFVPLLHEFIKGILLRDAGVREFYPGGAAATTIAPASGTLSCTGPEGEGLPVSQDKTTGSVIIDRTKGSGFYRVSAAANPVAVLAVNPHPDESDLRSIVYEHPGNITLVRRLRASDPRRLREASRFDCAASKSAAALARARYTCSARTKSNKTGAARWPLRASRAAIHCGRRARSRGQISTTTPISGDPVTSSAPRTSARMEPAVKPSGKRTST